MTQNVPEWITILRGDVEATGSIQTTAERVGVSRGALSAILNQTPSSPYVNGKSSTKKIELRVLNTIGRILCPFLSELMGADHRITGIECREHAGREYPPTNSPRAMAHWRACQGCDKRVMTTPQAKSVEKSAVPANKPPFKPCGLGGKADSGEAAFQEGWDCIGGPNDNPYPEVDSRSDYWRDGYKQRREFDKKQRERINKRYDLPEQQAGVVDVVTLPLPEVGGPMVDVPSIQTGMVTKPGKDAPCAAS